MGQKRSMCSRCAQLRHEADQNEACLRECIQINSAIISRINELTGLDEEDIVGDGVDEKLASVMGPFREKLVEANDATLSVVWLATRFAVAHVASEIAQELHEKE